MQHVIVITGAGNDGMRGNVRLTGMAAMTTAAMTTVTTTTTDIVIFLVTVAAILAESRTLPWLMGATAVPAGATLARRRATVPLTAVVCMAMR
jgi:hypothetical protein